MTKSDTYPDSGPRTIRRRANGWPVLPLRIFLAALFLFAGYAKLTYPHFFDPTSLNGFKASISSAKSGTPIGGLLGPLSDHPSVFGHVTAFAEIAIGLGLLLGLLTRVAAAGGIVLMAAIVLSIDWNGVKEYTGSSGWFTSVDLAVGAALSVYLIGGADPFSLDALIWRARLKRREEDDLEPSFHENTLAESRARLTGEYPAVTEPVQRPAPEPEPNSLWSEGRRDAAGRPMQAASAEHTQRFEPVEPTQRFEPVERTERFEPATRSEAEPAGQAEREAAAERGDAPERDRPRS
ncbi:MAG TPA: DoxX family protein [Jatrophihabitans sp.]|nr:DoxX family protein [Jatrophihabitans sp.]